MNPPVGGAETAVSRKAWASASCLSPRHYLYANPQGISRLGTGGEWWGGTDYTICLDRLSNVAQGMVISTLSWTCPWTTSPSHHVGLRGASCEPRGT